MKHFEIWYKDLNPEAQKRYLETQGVSISPLAIIDIEEQS